MGGLVLYSKIGSFADRNIVLELQCEWTEIKFYTT